MSTDSNFFSRFEIYVARVSRRSSKLLAMYPFFCFLLASRFSSTPSLLFFLSHPHSHSNLFERIIHARVMLEMHSREEGSVAIHRVRHSLYFIFCYFLFFFLAIIRRIAGAHIFCRGAVRCKSQLYSRYFGERNWFSNFCTSTYSGAL